MRIFPAGEVPEKCQPRGFRLPGRKAPFTHQRVSPPEVTTEQPPAPSTGSAMHVLVLGLTVILGLAISLGAFVLVRNWEQERVQRAFEAQARKLAQNLAVALANYEEALYSLRDVFTASQEVNFSEFRAAWNVHVVAAPTEHSPAGKATIEFDAIVRIDTPGEADYYRNGGILQCVLRSLV